MGDRGAKRTVFLSCKSYEEGRAGSFEKGVGPVCMGSSSDGGGGAIVGQRDSRGQSKDCGSPWKILREEMP